MFDGTVDFSVPLWLFRLWMIVMTLLIIGTTIWICVLYQRLDKAVNRAVYWRKRCRDISATEPTVRIDKAELRKRAASESYRSTD